MKTKAMTRAQATANTDSVWSRRGRLCLLATAAALLTACSGGLGPSETELLTSAQAHLQKREFATAEIELKSALQKNPQNGQARLLLGTALQEVGNAAGAEVELRRALELGQDAASVHPRLAAVLLAQGKARDVLQQFGAATYPSPATAAEVKVQLALAHIAVGEADRARDRVAAALNEDPKNAGAKLLQARFVAGGGDLPGALALVDEVLAADAQHLGALLLKGELHRFGRRDADAAKAAYIQAAQAHPSAVPAHVALVQLALDNQDTDGARKAHAAMRAAAPSHPETRLYEAQLAFIDENHERVRALTAELLRIAPDDPRLVQLAGVNELRLNSLTQAEAHLRKVSAGLPNALVPRQLLAGIYNRTGQPGKALEILQPVIASPQADSNSLTLAGQALLQTGDLAQAEALFKRAARANPGASTARAALALGQVARGEREAGFAELEAVAAADTGASSSLALIAARLRTNDVTGAMRAIEELEKKQPQSPVPHTLRASIQLQQRNTVAAAASFEQALKLDPQYFEARAGLAAIDLAASKPEAAEDRFNDLLRTDPRHVRALLALAELKARTGGNKDEITVAITRAVQAAPDEPSPRVLLVNHLLRQRENAAALSAAQNAAAALPDNPDVLDVLGVAQLASNQNQQAISTFARLAGLRPDQPGPELGLADAHQANNDLNAARRSLNKALQIRPGLFAAQRGLVLLALRENRHDEALRVAQTVQRAQPREIGGYLLQADIELARRQPAAAVEPLRKALGLNRSTELAVRLHGVLAAANRGAEADRFAAGWTREQPRDAAFRFYLGDRALATGDYAAAEAHYRTVLEVQPENALTLNNVAWLMAQQNKPGALAPAERANQLLPDQPALMDTLAWVLARENQVPRAVELQRRAMAKAPQDQSLRLTLAKIYLQGGDKTQARTELEALAQLGDGFGAQAEVKQLLATL